MKSNSAEIVAIGSELLSGLTVNSNAAYLSRELTLLGFNVQRHTVLPDDPEILKEGLAESMGCASIVIATGGLGPTCDDLSRSAAAELFDSSLHFDEVWAAELKARYGDLIFPTLENQATVPAKALVLPNPIGTAAGLIFHDGLRTLILLPGVPIEMKELFSAQVVPFLKKHFRTDQKLFTEEIYFSNTYEAQVDPTLRKLKEEYPDLSFGIYPSLGLLTVQIQTQSDPLHLELASAFLKKQFAEKLIPGPIEGALHALFTSKNMTLSLAESCTGGAMAARLVSWPGASQYFLGSIVAYSNELKTKILQVPEAVLQEYGAVSAETAVAMAEGVRALTKSTYSIAITGIAGPSGGTPEKPVGTVFYAISGPKTLAKHLQGFGSARDDLADVNAALGSLYHLVS